MPKPTDFRPVKVELYFLPIKTRVPLKFGPEILTEVTCARVKMTVEDRRGNRASGWGETPLSVQWVWPSSLSYEERHEALRSLCLKIAAAWLATPIEPGHPIEVGHHFLENELPDLTNQFNQSQRHLRRARSLARSARVRVGLRSGAARRFRHASPSADIFHI